MKYHATLNQDDRQDISETYFHAVGECNVFTFSTYVSLLRFSDYKMYVCHSTSIH